MSVPLLIARRALLTPSLAPILFLAGAGAWVGSWLARAGLGGDEGFVEEVRQGSLLFAGALALSLAEPLAVARDARAGPLLLRLARGGGCALFRRALGLLLATLPAVLVAAVAAGGRPPQLGLLLVQLGVLVAGGLLLGACFDRARLVPALWGLLVVGHLRPWLMGTAWGRPVGWMLPRLGELGGGWGLVHALLWAGGALLLADWRLRRVVGRASA